jgi:hypothetical protein
VNHKRVERIWRREGLKVPQKQPKRGRLWLNDGSCVRLRPEYKDHVWSYDFMIDRISNGRAFPVLNKRHDSNNRSAENDVVENNNKRFNGSFGEVQEYDLG